jgi:hypothetical protein
MATKVVKVSQIEKVKAGKTDRIVLHYEMLDGPKKGEVWKIGALAIKLPDASRTALKDAKVGDNVEITMEKDGNYWNLTEVKAADANTTTTQKTSQQHTTTQTKAPFDNVGVKVGAARNQAIAYLAATGMKFTLDTVDDVAYEIISRQQIQEDNVRAGNNPFDHKVNDAKNRNQDLDDDVGF